MTDKTGAAAAPRTDPPDLISRKALRNALSRLPSTKPAPEIGNWYVTSDDVRFLIDAAPGAAESGASPAVEDRGLAALLTEALGPKRPPKGTVHDVDFDAGWNDCRDFVLRTLAALPHGEPARTPDYERWYRKAIQQATFGCMRYGSEEDCDPGCRDECVVPEPARTPQQIADDLDDSADGNFI